MKISICIAALLVVLFTNPTAMSAGRPRSQHGHHYYRPEHTTWPSTRDSRVVQLDSDEERRPVKLRRAGKLQIAAGSRLPDCSHACGSCSPCRLVMVSFVCATLPQAETCPISYRCMCNRRSYPIP